MPSSIASIRQAEIQGFLKTSLCAILRAEAAGRVPSRFTGTGVAVWNTFRNELTAADLVALSIQDVGVTMPVPFDPSRWWPGWPDWSLLGQSPAEAEGWIEEALAQADQSHDAYLREQAAALGVELPLDEAVAALSTPARHERWLELPGTGGWLAYALCTRPDAELYLWENFTILCARPQEMLLAGLIAWELGAPPHTELPIRLDGPDLRDTLKAGETYHAVVGRRELHGHRDLRILHANGEPPLWVKREMSSVKRQTSSVNDHMHSRTNTSFYGPLTKSINVDEVLMLIELTREYPSVADWQDEALFRLPQASRQRRQEIIRSVRGKFLQVENEHFVTTPLLTLLTTPTLDQRLKRDLLFAQYLRTTPLVWEAIQQVALPHAEAGGGPLAKPEDAEIPQSEWDELLKRRLRQYTDSTLSRTRQHITAHLTKFGLLEARPVPGDRIAKRFYAHFYEPDPRAFWFSLVLEFAEQGWTSRSLDYITNQSWTRIAYCTKTTYARFIIEEAEREALVATDFFGSEKQVTLQGPDPLANVVEAVRYG